MRSTSVWLKPLAALVIGLAGAAAAHAGPYSSLYVFGDSLSDVGNDAAITAGAVPKTSIYSDGTASGRFTNGLNYADRLAASLGLGLAPSLLGGTDYAYGGARTNSVSPGLQPYGAKSFTSQLSSYYATHTTADPNGLYVLWIGANDLSDAITLAAGGSATAIQSAVASTLAGIGSALIGLQTLGAQHFLIPNLPDLALVPAINGRGSPQLSALAHAASTAYNAQLGSLLSGPTFSGVDIHGLDVYSAQLAVTANPAAYGISNVTSACYSGEVDGSALIPGGPAPTVCSNPGAYLYFDYEHPTAALHTVLGAMAFAAVVPEPETWALMLVGIALVGWRSRQALTSPNPAEGDAATGHG